MTLIGLGHTRCASDTGSSYEPARARYRDAVEEDFSA
jgi:hypothetical protein